MEKRWKILQASPSEIAALEMELKINPVLCRILVQRGITDFWQAEAFFHPQLSQLHSPWLMKDMDKAVDRILRAVSRKEKILVYGDYDVDGTTAVASLFQFLHENYDPALVDFYIPHRYNEGYGISEQSIHFAQKNGFNLVISLDCGIKSIDIIGIAQSIGIDFIVCDHHLPESQLPPAVAILNPKQPECPYPNKELSGCGVGFKLISALSEKLLENQPAAALRYLDLVAVSIAGDIVPMTGENRVLSYYGLEKINKYPNNGIKALIQQSEFRKELKMLNLVFLIAPRINAAGRMDDARKVVHMLTASDYDEALLLAGQLHADNTDRKEADSNTTGEALAMLEKENNTTKKHTTVVYQPHWHKGVVGIVASRLIDRYYRPTVVLTSSGGLISGSARSVNGFNIYEAIHACREHLLHYGGHYAAAGLTLLPENMEAFCHKFEEVVSAMIQPGSLAPELSIDAEILFSDIDQSFYRTLSQMEPFGPGNTQPVFITRNVINTGYSYIAKEQHIRFSLQQGNITMDGIGFNLARKFPLLTMGEPVDVLFTIEENVWNNQVNLQLKVIDFDISRNGSSYAQQ